MTRTNEVVTVKTFLHENEKYFKRFFNVKLQIEESEKQENAILERSQTA